MTKKQRAVKLGLTLIFVPLIFQLVGSAFDIVAQILKTELPSIPSLLFVLFHVALLHLVMSPWMRIVYGASYFKLIGSQSVSINRAFVLAQVFLLGVFLLSEPLFLVLNWSKVSFHLQSDWAHWWLWLVPIIIAIFLQTTAEEYIFRGYLQSQLKGFGWARWIYVGLPAILWASIHQAMFDDMELKIAVVLQMLVVGLILGDWADRARSILAPIFVHFLLNSFTMLFYGNTLRPTQSYILQADFTHISRPVLVGYFVLVSLAAIISYRGYVLKKMS